MAAVRIDSPGGTPVNLYSPRLSVNDESYKSDDSDIISNENDDHDNIYDMVNQDKIVANDKDDNKGSNEQDGKNDNNDMK